MSEWRINHVTGHPERVPDPRAEELERQGHIFLTPWLEVFLVIEMMQERGHSAFPGQGRRFEAIHYEDGWRGHMGIPSIYQ